MATTFSLSRVGIDVNLPLNASYDLLLVSTPEYPVGLVEFKFEETPRKITGIQKVAQLFIKTLFTRKGSDVLRPNSGTTFQEIVHGSNLQLDDTELQIALTDSISDAERQVKYSTEIGNDPASTLSKIEVVGFSPSLESLNLYIWVVTAAGEKASVAIPFPELDLPITSK